MWGKIRIIAEIVSQVIDARPLKKDQKGAEDQKNPNDLGRSGKNKGVEQFFF